MEKHIEIKDLSLLNKMFYYSQYLMLMFKNKNSYIKYYMIIFTLLMVSNILDEFFNNTYFIIKLQEILIIMYIYPFVMNNLINAIIRIRFTVYKEYFEPTYVLINIMYTLTFYVVSYVGYMFISNLSLDNIFYNIIGTLLIYVFIIAHSHNLKSSDERLKIN